jgi:hypothetical protein
MKLMYIGRTAIAPWYPDIPFEKSIDPRLKGHKTNIKQQPHTKKNKWLKDLLYSGHEPICICLGVSKNNGKEESQLINLVSQINPELSNMASTIWDEKSKSNLNNNLAPVVLSKDNGNNNP